MNINGNANLKSKGLKNDLKLMYMNCHFSAFTEDTVCVGLSRVGSDAQRIVSATLQEMTQIDLGEPLHSLIIPGEMHSLERDMLLQFAISDKTKNILSSVCIWDSFTQIKVFIISFFIDKCFLINYSYHTSLRYPKCFLLAFGY